MQLEDNTMEEKNVWKVVVIVASLFILMVLIARVSDHAKVELALNWTKTLVGIFLSIAGVGSSTISLRATSGAKPLDRFVGVGPGVVGVLAGSTLLGVGGWAAPVALGISGLGLGIGIGLAGK